MVQPLMNFPRGLKGWWKGHIEPAMNAFLAEHNELVINGVTNATVFDSYTVTSGVNVTLSTLATVNSITTSTGSLTVKIPSASGEVTVYEGGLYSFENAGSNSFSIIDNADGAIITLAGGEACVLGCVDDSDAAGTWAVMAQFFDNANLSYTDVAESRTASMTFSGGAAILGNPFVTAKIPTDRLDAAQTFALSDVGRLQVLTGSTNRVWTVPANASVAFATSDCIPVFNDGTAELTITAAGGVVVNGVTAGSLTLFANESGALIKQDTDRWIWLGTRPTTWAA